MNPIDDQMNRLFRAARAAQTDKGAPDFAPPFGLETRVLAEWKASRVAPAGIWDTALLLRGMIVAGVIMAVSFVPALRSTSATSTTTASTSTNPYSDFLQLADSTVPSDVSP